MSIPTKDKGEPMKPTPLLLSLIILLGQIAFATTPDVRESQLGYKFTRDSSRSGLGLAYRDPSGLIWGDLVRCADCNTIDKIAWVTYIEALIGCNRMAARLPTEEEIANLRFYLGYGSPSGFNIVSSDEKLTVLPNLSYSHYLLSSKNIFVGTCEAYIKFKAIHLSDGEFYVLKNGDKSGDTCGSETDEYGDSHPFYPSVQTYPYRCVFKKEMEL
jgi:hypothetical protein